jgi:hypothetical protein
MKGNDIAAYNMPVLGVFFEHLLAQAPTEKPGTFRWRKGKTDDVENRPEWIESWTLNDLPFRSLRHLMLKTGVEVEVYTMLGPTFVDAIDKYLFKWGLRHQSVKHFASLDRFKAYLNNFYEMHTVFVGVETWAQVIGPRARMCDVTKPLPI